MSDHASAAGTAAVDASQAVLIAAGMSELEAAGKAALLGRCEAVLDGWREARGSDASVRYFVPGRVEFLGKHTDYAGGRSLLCATERGICVAARRREDNRIRVMAMDLGEEVEFGFSGEIAPEAGRWSNYPMTVARRVAKNFPGMLMGADIAFAGDLSHAAGMSSSSALMIAIFLVLRDLQQLQEQPAYQQNVRTAEDLAGYLATIENGQTFGTLTGDKGVGTFGGSQDHTAILCSKASHLVQYSFCPVRQEATIPWPPGFTLAIGVSGVVAEKTGAALQHYNRVAERAGTLVRLWQQHTNRKENTVAAIVRSSPGACEELREILKAPETARAYAPLALAERLEQFVTESECIIPAAASAIAQRDLSELGKLVDQSQRNAEILLANQVPETIALARMARELSATAASAFGAGFGGAVWALIEESSADEFLQRWEHRYRAAFPRYAAAKFFLTHPGPPATKV